MLQHNMFSIDDCMRTARRFLETLCPPPWGIVAGGVSRNYSEKQLDQMQKLISMTYQQRRSVYVMLPETGGNVRHLVVHAPRGVKSGNMSPPPSISITARDVTMIWALNAPIPISEAQALSQRLAGRAGGRPGVGEAILLPGSVLFHSPGPMRTQRFPVSMMPPKGRAYRIANGELVSEAKPARPDYDARDLAVPLGTSAAGEVVWLPGRQSNGFMLVLGASGSGKTETLKTVGASIDRFGVPLLVFDFHGDVRIPGVKDVLLSSGTSSTHGLNPMELDGACAKESGLYDQRGALREMIQRACPALGHKQANALREAIERVYIQAGILDNDPTTWGAMPPSFADLIREIEDDGLRAGAAELFGHPIFSRQQHLSVDDLLARSTRLDLSKLSDGVRFIATETLLQRIFRNLRLRGPIPVNPADDHERFRLYVVIDEAKILAAGGDKARNILNELFTEARKFGLGMVLASQMAEHFSSEVRANASTWLVLKPQAMEEAKRNAPNVGVAPEQLMALKGRGDGYYRDRFTTEAQRVQVRAI